MRILGLRRGRGLLLAILAVFVATGPILVRGDAAPQSSRQTEVFSLEVKDGRAALRNTPLDMVLRVRDRAGDPITNFDWAREDLRLKGVEDLDGEALLGLESRGGDTASQSQILVEGADVTLRRVVLIEDPSLEFRGENQALALDSGPGWLAILPALLAIALAILFRQVLLALFAGIWVGGWILRDGPWAGFEYVVTELLPNTLADSGRLSIIIFSTLLGSVVALIARMGGTRGLVQAMSRFGESRRGAQVTTWFTGILVFFDDYANALLVGNTMRPITDKFRISREKLAFLVDSTSAPVACVVIISTWIAAEIGYIEGKLGTESVREATGWTPDQAYQIFLETIPYNFYPILCLVFGLAIAFSQRDFGPMRRAELRARHEGKLLADNAVPLSAREMDELEPADPKRQYWWNALIPIGVVIATVLGVLWLTGSRALEATHQKRLAEVTQLELADASPEALTTARELAAAAANPGLKDIFGNANSYHALLIAAFLGVLCATLLALGQKLLKLGETMEVITAGIKAMIPAVLVLALAWGLQDICERSHTSQWLIHHMTLSATFLPVLIFLLAALIGFSTGTSWGTMGILIPLTMDYVVGLGLEESLATAEIRQLMIASVGGVLAGAVFGDHCSPISDTTIMSSMSCGSDHVDHVKTQMPYAVTVAGVAIAVGYLPAGFGVSPWILLPIGALTCILIVRFVGRPTDEPS